MGTLAKRNSTSHIVPASAIGVILVDPSGSTPFGTTAPLPIRIVDRNGTDGADVVTNGASDAVAANGTLAVESRVFPLAFNGTTWDRARTPNVFKPFSVTVASIGTGQTVWTPASNKRFRLMGFAVTSDKAVQVNFKDGSVASIFATPALVAATPFGVSNIGNGMLSASANNLLTLDVSASVPVVLTGTAWGTDE